MIFAAPLWLWSLLAVPLLVVLELWLVGRDRGRMARLVSRSLWGKVVQRPAPAWRWIRLALLALGIAGIGLALARPQWGIVREKIEREGVDVVLVLDCSGSMATDDVTPDRFFLARASLLSLVEKLEGDRFALVAFEGEAYPLVPLTLDADAIGLFLETLEPGIVPAPGTSLGAGLERGLSMFVDEGRQNRVMVVVSDGEDLEGEIAPVVRKAKEAGVVVHAVGVGTPQGAPVPDVDANGERAGFKKDENGAVVVSRLNPATLEAIARGTGGQSVTITPSDTTLWQLAAAVEAMENTTLAREYAYRKKERYQIPLAVGLLAVTLGLLLPPPALRLRRRGAPPSGGGRGVAAVAVFLLVAAGSTAHAQQGRLVDELLLRPQRMTSTGREDYGLGDHPKAVGSFEAAAAVRPDDYRMKFNLADGLYKTGKYDEAAAIFRALGLTDSLLAGAARYNLGNSLFQKQDFGGAVRAYRDALALQPDDQDTRHNLELALRALEEQQRQQQEQQQPGEDQRNDEQQQQQQQQQQQREQEDRQQPEPKRDDQQQRPKTAEEKEREKFLKETGMPKERAQQLLDALQESEKAEQKKQLAAQRAGKKKGKDW